MASPMRKDPDYLALKAKGCRPIKILASQAAQAIEIIIERDEEIERLVAENLRLRSALTTLASPEAA